MDLAVYCDASGKEGDSQVLTIGGVIGLPVRWEAFSVEWAAAMSEWKIDAFHMSTFENRQGVFKDWPDDTRRARLGHLMDIIGRYAEAVFGVAIPLAEFDEVFHEPTRSKAGGAYGVAATKVFIEVANLAHQIVERPYLAYVYELGDAGRGQISSMFRDNYDNPRNREAFRLRSLAFEPKTLHLPLQAADIVAYEVHKQFRRQTRTVILPPRWPMRKLSQMLHLWTLMGRGELNVAQMEADHAIRTNAGNWTKATTRARRSRRKSKGG